MSILPNGIWTDVMQVFSVAQFLDSKSQKVVGEKVLYMIFLLYINMHKRGYWI